MFQTAELRSIVTARNGQKNSRLKKNFKTGQKNSPPKKTLKKTPKIIYGKTPAKKTVIIINSQKKIGFKFLSAAGRRKKWKIQFYFV